MKNFLLYFLLLIFFYNCNSQKNEVQKPLKEPSISEIIDLNYFLGNWYLTNTYFINGMKKELQPQTKCENNSYWKFQKDNEILKQSKITAKGNHCEELIATKFGTVNFTNNQLNYFVDDVLYSVKIKILSQNKFSTITNDLIEGKMVQIEKIYVKK